MSRATVSDGLAPSAARDSGTVDIALVANARMPSQRAQSVQLARAAFAFEAAGARTVVVHAKRRDTPIRPAGEVWSQLGASGAEGRAPSLVAASCVDWIDALPRSLQFGPARVQEWTFGREAARLVREGYPDALVLARDVEVAHALRGRGRVGLEIHRVPGGRVRREWLTGAVEDGAPVVAISGGVRDDLVALGVPAERILVEHDAHDPALEAALPSRDEARRRLGLDADRPIVLYAGGLLRWKGVDVLVDAARSGRLDDARVMVVGGMDADVEALRARARGVGNVDVIGYRPAHDVPLYLAAADVAVVPNRRTPRISSHYTSPLKVFEAMAACVPLVVSDLPSLCDVLAADEATFVEPEDPVALAEGVRRVLDDPAGAAEIADRAYEAVRGRTWEARARRILDFLEALA
ncbi:MAG: glycosyltransferase family 4 protein [Planctomycetota bacterium]